MTYETKWPDAGIDGFRRAFATIDGVRLHYVVGGKEDGDVVVLFPGFPQSWYAWRKIMPGLGEKYRVIALDLPGQGDSDRLVGTCDTSSAARLVRGLMEKLDVGGHYVVAHDVGAWVAYPYAALFRESVLGLAILDTGIPGISLPDLLPWSAEKAWRTWHVAFHNLADLPEILIGGKEDVYLRWFLERKAANPRFFSDADFSEYLRVFLKNGLKGGLAFYRGITVSAEQNRALADQPKLEMPILAVRADQGSMPDLVAQLQKVATNVQGTAVENCGHYLAEEQPEALLRELLRFLP